MRKFLVGLVFLLVLGVVACRGQYIVQKEAPAPVVPECDDGT